jgi:Uma2 family endonuclease
MAVTSSTGLPIFQIDTETYDQMVCSGALEGQRVELLDGIITRKSPQSPFHAAVVERLTAYLFRPGGLRVQLPLIAGDLSVPEPDVAVIEPRDDVSQHPSTALLVVEVAHSSHRVDRGIKERLYAEAQVPVYWVVDIPGHVVEVRTEPAPGGYRSLTTYGLGTLLPSPLPDLGPLAVSDLFAGIS